MADSPVRPKRKICAYLHNDAYLRLKQECATLSEVWTTSQGKVLSELIMAHLKPHPTERKRRASKEPAAV